MNSIDATCSTIYFYYLIHLIKQEIKIKQFFLKYHSFFAAQNYNDHLIFVVSKSLIYWQVVTRRCRFSFLSNLTDKCLEREL